jgi:hypothetical protein
MQSSPCVNKKYMVIDKSRCSAVGIATGYGLENRGVWIQVPVGSRNFSSPLLPRPALRPTQPPIQRVLGVFFSWGGSGRGMKLTVHFQLVPRSRKLDLYIHSPIHLHSRVLRKLSTRATLYFMSLTCWCCQVNVLNKCLKECSPTSQKSYEITWLCQTYQILFFFFFATLTLICTIQVQYCCCYHNYCHYSCKNGISNKVK